MSRGFKSADISNFVKEGIIEAFKEWESWQLGEWLQSAPEYLLTVNAAQAIARNIPVTKRSLWLEGSVSTVLKSADGIQRGVRAEKLRHSGNFDLVVGNGAGKPRVIVELKNGIWTKTNATVFKDLNRICQALLFGKEHSNLYSGVFAFYASAPPPLRKYKSGTERLEANFGKKWESNLKLWDWAKENKKKFGKNLVIKVNISPDEREVEGEVHAWAVVCVSIVKKRVANKLVA